MTILFPENRKGWFHVPINVHIIRKEGSGVGDQTLPAINIHFIPPVACLREDMAIKISFIIFLPN